VEELARYTTTYGKVNSSILSLSIRASAISLAAAASANATLADWEDAVNAGAQPASVLFATINGTAPMVFNVGELSGPRSFEFIVNAGDGGMSSALMGNQFANGGQGLKFEQWQDSGLMGITNFTVIDLTAETATPLFAETHVVFTSDNVDTNLYINGTKVFTFFNYPLLAFGDQGIAAAYNGSVFFDALDGDILGFASYDLALSDAEVAAHSAAFAAVPEPSTLGIAAVAGMGLLARRRRQRI